MRGGGHVDYPGALAVLARLLQDVQQQVGQQEVAQVVEGEVELEPVLRLSLGNQHGSSCVAGRRGLSKGGEQMGAEAESGRQRTVVDQDVQGQPSASERLDKEPHGFQRSQVHVDKLRWGQKNTPSPQLESGCVQTTLWKPGLLNF